MIDVQKRYLSVLLTQHKEYRVHKLQQFGEIEPPDGTRNLTTNTHQLYQLLASEQLWVWLERQMWLNLTAQCLILANFFSNLLLLQQQQQQQQLLLLLHPFISPLFQDISWTICKQSAPRSRQITTPTSHHSIFTGRMLFLTPNQQRQSNEGKALDYAVNHCWDMSNVPLLAD